MIGPFPSVILIKFPRSGASETIAEAEIEFETAIRNGIPSIRLDRFGRATGNDVERIGLGVYVEEHCERLTFSYLGSRISNLGVQLHAFINFFDEKYSASHAHDLPFLKEILAPTGNAGGLVMVGQTAKDRRVSAVIVSGLRGDVFSYLLGARAGYGGVFSKKEPDMLGKTFPTAAVATFARSVLGCDGVVSVPFWGAGRFLRECFNIIDRTEASSIFQANFGDEGKSWRNWNLHRIMRCIENLKAR